MKTGIELIAEERQEQIEKHGRTVEHDIICNDGGQLIDGAFMLLREMSGFRYKPFGWNKDVWERMKNKNDLQRYIIAGALIAAEIDRIQAIESSKEN